jgi:mannose-6-phosphate isomerase-like protein (cupin superfamily)
MTIQTKTKVPQPRLAETTQDWVDQLAAMAEVKTPYAFDIHTPLLKKGRTNKPLAATDQMSVVLKAYAEGGENEVHAHPNEDHIFVILQGQAEFFGPNDERTIVGRHQGLMLPAGSFYRFHAHGDENLILLRIGTKIPGGGDPIARIHADGSDFDGYSEANKRTETIMDGDRWFK